MTTPPGENRPTVRLHTEPIPPVRQTVWGSPYRPVLLADEFFLLAHDDRDGKPRLHDRAMTYGLAAALLAELGTTGRISIDQGQLAVLNPRPPDDWLQHVVLARLIAAPQHTATRTWLAYLAATSYNQVAQRLWQAGKVKPQEHRRLFGSRTVHVPTDVNVAAWSWMRLSDNLRRFEQLDPFDLALMGIVQKVGLDRWILDGATYEPATDQSPPVSASAHLRQLLAEAPLPLRDLLDALDAAIGSAVMSHRA